MQTNNTTKFNKFTIQQNFAISAGAGSGKTYTLSRRYINAVLGFDFFTDNKENTNPEEFQANFIEFKEEKKADVSQIITMTYTKAAALEMSERIFELMEKIINFDSLANDDGDYNSIFMGMKKLNDKNKEYVKSSLENALHNSNNAFISTIHAFCLDLIASNSDIAKLDSKISTIEDVEKLNILNAVKIETLTANDELAYKVFKSIDKFKANQLIEKYTTNSKFRDSFDFFVKNELSQDIYKEMILELYPLPDICDEVYEELDDTRSEWLKKYIGNFKNFKALSWGKLKKDETAPKLGASKYPIFNPIKEEYEKLISTYSLIDDEKESEFFDKLKDIQSLLEKIYIDYVHKLHTQNKIDFDTIISKTAQIINKVETNYKYIMVDEFQDTNSLQNEIVNKISKNCNLFVVGDSKQSIYSFQGAELEVFNNAINATPHVEPMSVNYRSDKKILSFVNDVFKKLFEQDESKDSLLVSNFKAMFTQDDELQPSSDDKDDGKVEYLISQDIDSNFKDGVQYKNLAAFIKSIKENEIDGYEKIKEKIANNEKAIGVLFDSKTKMMLLKKELNDLGVECKVSASENFYHTKEINDIYLTLKSCELLRRKERNKDAILTNKENFFIAGALRSNIFNYDEKQIVQILQKNYDEIYAIFSHYIEVSKTTTISSLIKYIVDNSKLLDIYSYLGDIDQRASNIEKFIDMTIAYETNNSSDLYSYTKELTNNIYFIDDSKENEAFYKSDDVESIELCTIHSTKGLAYPMVIVAQTEKDVVSKSSGDMGVSFNSFTININNENVDYSTVAFKLGEYEPLALRVIKQISRNKGEAERKRLLYVALTRAEHNLVVSGAIYQNKPAKATKKNPNPIGDVGLQKNSYLSWLTRKSFGIENQTLLENNILNIELIDKTKLNYEPIVKKEKSIVKYSEQKIIFKTHTKKTASNTKEHNIINKNMVAQATIGTDIHSILELYWDKLDDEIYENTLKTIYFKYSMFEDSVKSKIKKYLDNFKNTTTYQKLKSGAKHHFELDLQIFKDETHTQGIIDLVYFDEELDGWVIVDFKSNNIEKQKDLKVFAKTNGYDSQLDTYAMLCEEKEMNIVDKLLLFVQDGSEVKF